MLVIPAPVQVFLCRSFAAFDSFDVMKKSEERLRRADFIAVLQSGKQILLRMDNFVALCLALLACLSLLLDFPWRLRFRLDLLLRCRRCELKHRRDALLHWLILCLLLHRLSFRSHYTLKFSLGLIYSSIALKSIYNRD